MNLPQDDAFESPSLFSDEYCAKRGIDRQVLEQVTLLAIELAREGREGRKIGTIFVIGDSLEVMRRSQALILDPLFGHPDERKRLDDPNLRETLKELSQLDGAFVISDEGIALSACRYLSAPAESITLPLGLGSRHMAAASITRQTKAVAVVVSESSMVRIFDDGELVSEIIPEVWMLRRYRTHVAGRAQQRTEEKVTVVSKDE